MKYQATLTREEVKKFCVDFFELHSASATNVDINPDERHMDFIVILTPEEACVKSLEASFEDGMLNSDGWDKKFKKVA